MAMLEGSRTIWMASFRINPRKRIHERDAERGGTRGGGDHRRLGDRGDGEAISECSNRVLLYWHRLSWEERQFGRSTNTAPPRGNLLLASNSSVAAAIANS